MRSRSQLLGCIAALAALMTGHLAAANQHGSHREEARQQLSLRLARHATTIMAAQQQPTLEAVEIATLLAREAVGLDPANEYGWRIVLQLAEMAEDISLQDEALQTLAQLDPADEVVRLKRAQRLIERHQTVEDRVAEYRNLLSGANRQRLGDAVASRLALDLALLERRVGNSEQFAHWLAESVALDPSHRSAAALAAGYFHANVSDPFAQGELLVALLMADPIQVAAQMELAGHLLDHAAYKGAQRLYTLTVKSSEAGGVWPSAEIVADLAIAQWGDGDTEAALRTVRDFQRRADIAHRRQLQEQRPEMTSLERARESALIDPTLAVIRAAIHRRLSSEQADSSMERAVTAYERLIEAAGEQEPPDLRALAQYKLELAWVMVWLDGSDSQRVQALLADIEQYDSLSPSARARFDGWLALHAGDEVAAIEILLPFVEKDAAAAVGYATALLNQGRHREAARELLRISREQAGTIIGLWSLDVLWEVLGQRTSVATETGLKLERLVAGIPNVVDQFPADPSTAFSIRVTPAKATFQPNEPVIVNLEITNHAPFPIAIGRDGPIRSQALLNLSAEMVRAGRHDRLPPVVVDIDRRLRLMPRERLVVPVDLRTTALGLLLDRAPLPGAMVRVKAILNFIVTPQGAIMPGVLGMERETAPFRVDGFRVTAAWVEQTMASLIEEPGNIDLARLVSLAHLVAGPMDDQPDLIRRLFRDARTVLIEVFPRLDSDTQAWLLSVLPSADAYAPIRAAARQSEHRAVQLSYLLHQVARQDDPMLTVAARSGDPTLKRLAELALPRMGADDDQLFGLPPAQ